MDGDGTEPSEAGAEEAEYMKWLGRTKEAAMRKKEERKKHDKLAIATRRALPLLFMPLKLAL